MRRALLAATLAGAAAAALIVALGAGASGQSPTVMRVVERATTDVVTDTGKKGDSAGDVLTFANAVYNASNTAKIGSDQGYCLRTAVGKSWECNWTTIFPGGSIVVEGPFYDAGDSTLAITGGTGGTRNARGTMKLHARNAQGTAYDFTFVITKG